MSKRPTFFPPVALVVALATIGGAAHGQAIKGSAALRARATVRGDSARAIALARVPNGRVTSAELEEEKGRLIYSFDIAVPGKSGIEEIAVDARTGAVVAQEHETPADERREARQAGEARTARPDAAGRGAKARTAQPPTPAKPAALPTP